MSEEEKKAAREAAIKKLQEEELAKLKKRQQAKRENNTEVQTQLTLFDMKPKTKLQMEIVNGSRKLAPVSEAQKSVMPINIALCIISSVMQGELLLFGLWAYMAG
ncbi:hypothetical protein NXV57_27325 [Bacteroides thetaiotaomicron]|nr:hypothetical protein [Bacteroides thetaiotaomicron]